MVLVWIKAFLNSPKKIKVTFHKPSYIMNGSSLSGHDDYVDVIYWLIGGTAYINKG